MRTFNEPIVHQHDMFNVFSNLIYPMGYGYYYDVRVDDKWVEERLHSMFGKRNLKIANKYVVEITVNSGNKVLVVNHDGKHYLIQKEADKK